jgi:hypothetical protein
MVNINSELRKMWQGSRPLTAVFLIMLLVFVANVLGMYLDSRVITGAPVWLKPAKFAISVAIFTATLAWILRYVPGRKRAARMAGAIAAICASIEIVVIDLQAARGTTSHFNVSTRLDSFLFALMGVSILVLWLATVWLCVLLFRARFVNRPLGWALRLGLLISVAGSILGGLMVRPTPAQRAVMDHSRPSAVGAHTVGGPDGGAGLPLVKWSTEHGDLRIPHFLGLHGLQAVPLFYFFIRRRRREVSQQTQQVIVAAASYAALTTLLGWQALRGQSIVRPDTLTLALLALWAAGTIAGLLVRWQGQRSSQICCAAEAMGS